MKIVIAGNYGAKNIGDEMILKGMIKAVKKGNIKDVHPDSEITVLSANPKETAEKFHVKSEYKFPAGIRSAIKAIFKGKNKTKKAVKECDIFILGGGGLFGNLTVKADMIWGIQAFKAYRYGKKVYMYGQSVGELKGKFRKWLVRKLFNKATLTAVRDEESKKLLESIGIHKEISVIPDLAFNIETQVAASRNDKEIVVALRQLKKLSKEFKKTVTDFFNWLIEEHNFKIKFIDFQTGKGKEADSILHSEIIKNIRKKEKIVHLKDIEDDELVLNTFAKASFALVMRLHSIISAIKTNTPFIAINYAPKVKAILKDKNLTKQMLEMKDLKLEDLKALAQSLINLR
jgi:polysaccharide pyruvyl transferase CsaB